MKRYPIDPLLRRLEIEIRPGRPEEGDVGGVVAFTAELNEHEPPAWWTQPTWPPASRTIQSWSASGVNARQADWLACHLGKVHPIDIWPEWDEDGELEGFGH